jgi:hypothetical protein
MSRPTVKKGPASAYALSNEAIVEFSDDKSGGLISISRDRKDRLIVSVYRTDEDVHVRAERVLQKGEV